MSSPPPNSSLDILAIAAHRDDVEQTCGGTLLKAARRGQRAGILDLTQGEMGTRGTAEDRAREADDAARILGVSWRRALDLPDGRVENTWENRLKVANLIRETRPRVVILPYWKGRHPDHYTASVLGYEACFLAGLAKLDPAKAPSENPGDGLDRQRLGEARYALEQHVPAGEQADEQTLEHRVLTDDHSLDLVQCLLQGAARLLARSRRVVNFASRVGVVHEVLVVRGWIQRSRPNQRRERAPPSTSRASAAPAKPACSLRSTVW